MSDRRLQVFHAVAKHRSFTKAAEVCCEDELQAICAPSHPIARLKAASAKQPSLIRNMSVVYPNEKFRSRLVDTSVQFAKERLAVMQAG